MDAHLHTATRALQSGQSHLALADLLTPEETGKLLGISVKTLAAWRSTGRHALPYIRCGARIRYQRHALAEWLTQRTQTSTAGEGGAQ